MRIPKIALLLLCLPLSTQSWGQALLPAEIEVLNEECFDCHTDMDEDEAEYTFPGGSVLEFSVDPDVHADSAHGSILACVSCHESYDDDHPDFEEPTEREYARARSELCESCHDDIVPLHSADSDESPLCTDCHSAHLDISFEAQPSGILDRCGTCHEQEFADFQQGGHSEALSVQEPNLDMPQCNTCHPAHEEPEGHALPMTARVTTLCIDCHSNSQLVLKYELAGAVTSSYMDDFHGVTFQHAVTNPEAPEQLEVMTCATCHGPHNVGPLKEGQVSEVCTRCHDGASTLFAGAWLGHGELGLGRGMLVWVVRIGYRFLIPFIVVGLLLNILIQTHHHLQRRKAAAAVGSPEQVPESGTAGLPATVVRFSAMSRAEHLVVILLFCMLVLTGLPQGYPRYSLASEIVDFWGGIASIRLVHRTCGFGFLALLVVHIFRGVIWTMRHHRRPDILPTSRDFTDALENLRYHLGMGPEPRFEKFDYREKFEYCGMVLGGCLIAVTGLLLIFPELATTYLPGIILTAARVAHGYEAMLALLVVLVWHVWGVSLRPEVFPCDTSIFTGRISLERMREEHGLEYEKLLGAHRRSASRKEPQPVP